MSELLPAWRNVRSRTFSRPPYAGTTHERAFERAEAELEEAISHEAFPSRARHLLIQLKALRLEWEDARVERYSFAEFWEGTLAPFLYRAREAQRENGEFE